ncbi:MAG: TIR domain-containing protein [Acidobacteriota bacterium]
MSAIFISHSSHDNEAAAEVRARLAELGHRSIFLDFDPADGIPAGRSWEQELYAQLRACQAIIVLCSEHSMASDWCFAEITHAKSLGKHVFPVRVEPCEVRSLLLEFQVLDLTVDKEDAFRRLWRGLEVAGLDPKNMFDWDGSRPPYPGLLAFQEDDAAIFFGRENEIREGLGQLRRLERFGGARWTLVLGASGSGKSSLVRAGLLPRLRRDHDAWLVTRPFRPLGQPFEELAKVMAQAFERHGAPRNVREIRRALDPPTGVAEGRALVELAGELRHAAERPEASLLLPLDQLEELLGAGTGDDAPRFLTFLRSAVEEKDSPVRILATLRSDFLGSFQGHPALRELAFESLTVGPMSAEGFAQVIEGPAEMAGIELEHGLVQAMVRDTETEDALPLLAFALRELWEGYGDDARLEVEEYRDKLGGLSGAVALAAEAVLAARPLSDKEEADLRTAFLTLVRVNDEGGYARRPARWSEMPDSVHDLLQRFVAARLFVAQGDGRENRLEVAHEALLRSWDRLVSWLEEDRAFLLWRKRLGEAREEWERTERHTQALLQGPALGEAKGWLEKRRDLLSAEEQAFIGHSLSAYQRNLRLRASLIALAMLIMLGFAGYSHMQRLFTTKVMEMSHDTNILTNARVFRQHDPHTAAYLLLDLHNPELFIHSLDIDRLHRDGMFLGKSHDEMLVALKSQGGADIQLILDSQWSVHLPHDVPVYRAVIEGSQGAGPLGEIRRPRGRRVLTAAQDFVLRLWELPEMESVVTSLRDAKIPEILAQQLQGDVRMLARFDGHRELVTSMDISSDGRFAASASGNQVALWRTDSEAAPLILGEHRAEVTTVSFGPESKQLLTTSAGGAARVFDLRDVFAAPRSLIGHKTRIISGAFNRTGDKALTLSEDGEIYWWKVATAEGARIASAVCDGLAIGFADISGAAILACTDGTARVLGLDDGRAKGKVQVLR